MSFNDFELQCLEAHNQYRAKHGSPALRLDQGLCSFAQQWAQSLAASNSFNHRCNTRYGENLYMVMGRTNINGSEAVKSWYDEIKQYNFHRPGFGMNTGHFSQVVWKGSQRLRVGVAKSGNRVYVVANYDPPGNMMSNFSANVTPLQY